jgi:hypothetical protein
MKLSKLIVSFLVSVSLFSQVLSAQVASTGAILGDASHISSKEKLAQVIAREDVATKFQELGVDSAIIEQRIASMTDEEASKIAYQIDTLPAGADAGMSVIGAIVFIFVVLLFTDIIGVTNVFNFTK